MSNDHRTLCTYKVNGIEHTALLDEDDRKRFNATEVSTKARTVSNKARSTSDAANSK